MATALARAPAAPPAAPKSTVSAVEMGARQREISVSEFFTKNRHLLGFDNPRKALLTAVKEAVDNALDACEEAGILPDVIVTWRSSRSTAPTPPASQATASASPSATTVPGIVRQQIPPIFAKLLYGSKFHRLRMSRGQQGIGISAAGMYGQLTTGKPVQIISRTGARAAAHFFEVQIDTKKNEPRIFESKKIDWEQPRGTQVTIELEGRYQKGRASVDEYVEQTAIANPHVQLVYHAPDGETREYPRAIEELPPQPKEIKPHPYGIELGHADARCCKTPRATRSAGFLAARLLPRVQRVAAGDLQDRRSSRPDARPRACPRRGRRGALQGDPGDQDHGAADRTASRPIGEEAILAGLLQGDQGRVLHGGDAAAGGLPRQPVPDRGGTRLRQRAGAAPAAVVEAPAVPLAEGEERTRTTTSWRASSASPTACRCSISSRRAPPSRPCSRPTGATTACRSPGARCRSGPMVIIVHMASVWVPFTSESKEAIADYDEIRKEIKLALQECGRRLGVFLRRRERAKSEFRRRNIFELYIEEVVEACNRLKGGKLPKDEAEGPAPEDRRQADRRRPDRRDPGQGRRPRRPAALDHRHARRAGGRGAGAARPRRRATSSRPRRSLRPRRRRRRAARGCRARRPRARRSRKAKRRRSGRRRRSGSGGEAHPGGEARPAAKRRRDRRRWREKAKATGWSRRSSIGVADVVITAAERSKDPTLAIPVRALSNVNFNERRGIIEMGKRKQARSFFNVGMAKKFMQTVLVADALSRAAAREPHDLAARDLLPHQAHHQGLAREHLRHPGRVRSAHRGPRGHAGRAARGAARARRERRHHRGPGRVR